MSFYSFLSLFSSHLPDIVQRPAPAAPLGLDHSVPRRRHGLWAPQTSSSLKSKKKDLIKIKEYYNIRNLIYVYIIVI